MFKHIIRYSEIAIAGNNVKQHIIMSIRKHFIFTATRKKQFHRQFIYWPMKKVANCLCMVDNRFRICINHTFPVFAMHRLKHSTEVFIQLGGMSPATYLFSNVHICTQTFKTVCDNGIDQFRVLQCHIYSHDSTSAASYYIHVP